MRVVALDEIRVVAVHRAHKVGDAETNHGVQLARKLTGLPHQVEREIFERLGAFSGDEWLCGSGKHASSLDPKMAGSMSLIMS